MRKLMLTLGAAAIALAAPAYAQGRGHGHGQGHGQGAEQGGRGQGQGRDAQRGRGRDDRAAGQQQGKGAERRAQAGDHPGRGHANDDRGRGREHAGDRGQGHASARAEDVRRDGRGDRRGRGRVERRAVLVANPRDVVRLRFAPERAFLRGCPPGLARKNNGCMPPGQARQLFAERPWYGGWWPRYGGNYRYWDGYLFRLEPAGIAAGFIPLAGGPLWIDRRWPAGYAYDPVPDYFVDYYGWDEPYDYRYADGIVYGLDPDTQMIRAVAGLLTGDDWGIGSRMPVGYDVYNVPYAYRDQYYDTPDDWYRYSDGYVYRVDPTTQLIEAAIRLIA